MNNDEKKQILAVSISRDDLNNIVNQFNGIKKQAAEKLVQGLEYASSDDFEKNLNLNIKKMKKTVKVVGTIATIALIFCPSDGPIGEIAAFLATSGFVHSVDKIGNSIKNAYKAGKNLYVASIKSDGSTRLSRIADKNIVKNVSNLKSELNIIKNSVSEMKDNYNSMSRK